MSEEFLMKEIEDFVGEFGKREFCGIVFWIDEGRMRLFVSMTFN